MTQADIVPTHEPSFTRIQATCNLPRVETGQTILTGRQEDRGFHVVCSQGQIERSHGMLSISSY